ncbi:hypothetical protein [Nocardia sp. NPDC051463]|uniref:hypothetical protein n=1 Tax=Nocardia sp. NPDC051463 TaxID=3154845 RepID=UPI003451052C
MSHTALAPAFGGAWVGSPWPAPTPLSGERIAIAACLGTGNAFDRAMGEFALAYADRTIADHRALVAAIASGRVRPSTDRVLSGAGAVRSPTG